MKNSTPFGHQDCIHTWSLSWIRTRVCAAQWNHLQLRADFSLLCHSPNPNGQKPTSFGCSEACVTDACHFKAFCQETTRIYSKMGSAPCVPGCSLDGGRGHGDWLLPPQLFQSAGADGERGAQSWPQLNTPGSVQHRLQARRLHRLGNCSVLRCQVTARSNEGLRISSACHALNTQMPTTQEHFGAVFFPTVPTDLADWPCCLTGVSSVNHNTEPVWSFFLKISQFNLITFLF